MAWQQEMQRFADLDEDDPQKFPLARGFLEAIGTEFLQGHQIVENRSDCSVELRGSWHNLPVRAKVDTNFALIEWEMKAPNPTGSSLFLRFDEDAIPAVGKFSGAAASAWDDDSEQKVFFGRGYYLEAKAPELPRLLAIYAGMPDEVRQALATYMVADRISKLFIYDRGSLYLGWSSFLNELPDVYHKVARAVWLMGQAAYGVSRVDPATLPQPAKAQGAGGLPAASSTVLVITCKYCGTRFMMPQNRTCPNCGAPPQ